jgi:HSP20 family protein
MAMIRWNPWSIQRMLEDDFDLPTIPGLSRLGSGLNLYETEDSFVAEVAIPGIEEDQIDITVDEGIVRISGVKRDQQEDKTKKRYLMSSMETSFNYSFKLPEGLVADKEPKAELHNGVLELTFPKEEKLPPKKISVSKRGN